jgi:tetratricopeptide (TPR) repeat protein
MNIFFSYPHDDNAGFVKRLKQDLESRGHTVWFDEAEIKTGDDWRSKITRGILESETVVAFLFKHAVRDPGVCLNEIAIALAEKGDEAIVTVLVEPEKDVSAPVSITHIQWLKMEDHLTQAADEGWYRTHFDKLVQVIENPGSVTRHDELGKLKDVLHPLSFNADIAYHLPRFTGRQWLVARYEDWLSKHSPGNANKVFRIEGGPGMGKTAVASYLAHATKSSVLGVHLCKSGSAITHNPGQLVLSLAYQMATRLPDYRARLLKVPCIKNPDLMKDEDAGSLWDMLISEPLAGAGKAGLIDRQRLAIVIDGLDEATKNGQNQIVELLVDHIQTLPSWVGVVLTGRPDPELTQSLKHYTPQVINGDDPANVEDLRHYIDVWLKDEVQANRLQAHQVPAATQALLQKSEGAFLYLAQAREEALQSNADGSASFDLSNPTSLPSGLNALYQKSFRRRFPDVQSDPDNPASRWNALVKPLLGFILASPEPLPLDIARELMGWDTDTAGNERQHKALQALGSLVKRNGNTEKPETCTLAPFHNSVREWLTSENSQGFRVFTDTALYPLTEITWKRYLHNQENDAYAWQVLPDLLPLLEHAKQDAVLGEPARDTSLVLYRLADSMDPKLRYTEGAACWTIQVRFSERLSNSDPENADFARDLSVSYNKLGDMQQALGNSQAALALYQQGLEIRERLFSSYPENAPFARDLSSSYEKLGGTFIKLAEIQKTLGRLRDALAEYELALKFAESASTRFPADRKAAHLVCSLYWQCLSVAEGDEKKDWFRRATISVTALKERGSLTAENQDFLAEAKARFEIEL